MASASLSSYAPFLPCSLHPWLAACREPNRPPRLVEGALRCLATLCADKEEHRRQLVEARVLPQVGRSGVQCNVLRFGCTGGWRLGCTGLGGRHKAGWKEGGAEAQHSPPVLALLNPLPAQAPDDMALPWRDPLLAADCSSPVRRAARHARCSVHVHAQPVPQHQTPAVREACTRGALPA